MPIQNSKHTSNQIQIIKQDQSKKFVVEFSKNIVSDELLPSRHKAGRLFNQRTELFNTLLNTVSI